MPAFSFNAGNGNDRINIVSTGATNDIGQFTICENSIDSAVPSAMRKMRTLAMLMRWDSEIFVLPINTAIASEGVGQNTGNSYVYLSNEIEEPVVAGINDYRSLGTDADTKPLGPVFQLKLDLNRETLRIT